MQEKIEKDDVQEGVTDNDRDFILIVNGEKKRYDERKISFRQVVELAFGRDTNTDKTYYTVTYKNGPDENPSGTMVAGQSVKVKRGMIFNVTPTGQS